MRLFETLSDMSKQHANAGDAGQYKYTHAEIEKQFEQRQTLSLYNLLDHSAADLKFLLIGIQRECQNLEPYKLLVADTYTSICAWAAIIEAAHKERVKRDSEAWAEKTAKEIKETLS